MRYTVHERTGRGFVSKKTYNLFEVFHGYTQRSGRKGIHKSALYWSGLKEYTYQENVT